MAIDQEEEDVHYTTIQWIGVTHEKVLIKSCCDFDASSFIFSWLLNDYETVIIRNPNCLHWTQIIIFNSADILYPQQKSMESMKIVEIISPHKEMLFCCSSSGP